MYCFYQDTILTVRPGLGKDNFATVNLKSSGGLAAVKSPAMPRVNDFLVNCFGCSNNINTQIGT